MKIGIVCYPTYGGSGVLATELGYWFGLKGASNSFYFLQKTSKAKQLL